MTTPTDGVEGTGGKLFYWTRQGISLADFQKAVDAAIALIEQHGGIVGITPLGLSLVTSDTQDEARGVIDAASTAQAAAGGGGGTGGTAINLPIAITDVTDLRNQLDNKSVLGHHHATGEIDGLATVVRTLLAAGDHAAMVSAVALAVGELAGINDVGTTALTATGATLADRQLAFRTAVGAASQAAMDSVISPIVPIYCPGNVEQPRVNINGTPLSAGQHAWFIKATIPSNMLTDDVWIPRDF